MAMTFTQTDSTTDECSGTSIGRTATSGGSAGSTPVSHAISPSATNERANLHTCIVGTATWSSGNWTWRLNVTTANMNLTLVQVRIRRHNSACAFQETLGDSGTISVGLNTTGVKSGTISCIAGSPAAGDKVICEFGFSNGAMSTQNFSWTPNQNIDSPFSAAPATSLLWNPYSFHPHLVR